MDGMPVQITETDKTGLIPYLTYAEDLARPFDDDHDEKIQIQTIEFAKSLGLHERDSMLHGTEDAIENVRKAILTKNAEERKLFETYDKNSRE